MAVTITLYNHVSERLANGDISLSADDIRLALVTSSYTFDAEHDEWADASSHELADGDGYSTGGIALANKTVSYAGGVSTFDADDVLFSTFTAEKVFRGGILYKDGIAGDVTDPVLAYILFDDTPADITITGVAYLVQWHASGIFRVQIA